MKDNLWGKTSISVYKYLGRFCGTIDKLTMAKALSSMNVSLSYGGDMIAISDAMIRLGERKINLINLKVAIEKALLNMNRLHAKMLISKYVDVKDSVNIAKEFNFCRRTYFRQIKLAENSFCIELCKNGLLESDFYKKFTKEPLIMETLKNIEKSKEENFGVGKWNEIIAESEFAAL